MPAMINNPPIPHLSPIEGGLAPGKMLRIQGSTQPMSQRFNINLQCGPNVSPRDDIALHLAVRLSDNYIARNSLIQQNWGEEQGQGPMPIGSGQQFEILVLCEPQAYKIAINGKHFCEFYHRIPIQRVTHLAIDGEVSITMINQEILPSGAGAGAAPAYGPPPPQMYGPQPGAPPMGAPGYSPYGPPPPPGFQPEEKGGLQGLLGDTGMAVAGALAGNLIGQLAGNKSAQPQQPQPPPQQPPQQQPPNPFAGGYGGQSVGGLGSIGGILNSALSSVLAPKTHQQPYKKTILGKQEKTSKKLQKKALKYGLPMAGAGIGLMALSKGVHFHKKHKKHKWGSYSSSSSSSSSSSDSD